MIHFRDYEKATAMDVIKLVLSTFIMPHATPEQKSKVVQHIAGMDAKQWMDIQATLYVGAYGLTQLVLTCSFAEKPNA